MELVLLIVIFKVVQPTEEQMLAVEDPALTPYIVIIFPLMTPLKMFGVVEEILYGVDPPKIVIVELCPAKMETVVWLKDIGPPVLAVELTLATIDPQLPA